jgi:hypothetical protein
MVVFSPWAFGTTQGWSIWTMNGCGYTLGLLLAVKLWIRARPGFCPGRWDRQDHDSSGSLPFLRAINLALAVVTVLFLAYCLVSALNFRAAYNHSRLSFDYRDCIRWLPHSYDRARSWEAFCNYLALALSFWAARDWLLGKTTDEERDARNPNLLQIGRVPIPGRLRLLLWLISLNGGLIALEGIAQRLEGSGKLLFLVKPRVNPGADTQFGPFAYRANGAQFLNLVWPVALGFWWSLRRLGRAGRGRRGWTRHRHHALLIAVMIMAASPVISTSRGGALVALGSLFVATLILFLSFDSEEGHLKLAVLGLFGGALAVGLILGWNPLAGRMDDVGEGFALREQMFQTAGAIARDYPVFGTGPGTFEFIFQFYRASPAEYWPAQLHNDWLETRITLGWVGLSMLLLALVLVLVRGFLSDGIKLGRRFTGLTWLALAGCLVHARWDFPFQIYSILFLFLLLCAVLTTLGWRPAR